VGRRSTSNGGNGKPPKVKTNHRKPGSENKGKGGNIDKNGKLGKRHAAFMHSDDGGIDWSNFK
jgi:hypothetical protein